jgi:hypothetical protein
LFCINENAGTGIGIGIGIMEDITENNTSKLENKREGSC